MINFFQGAFLIPYVIFMIGGGIPIFFLEVALGQYMSEGGITSWRVVPIATGEFSLCVFDWQGRMMAGWESPNGNGNLYQS